MTKLQGQFGKRNCSRRIDGVVMPHAVANKVGESPESKSELIYVMGVADQTGNEVARTDIVCEVAEKCISKGIVASILYFASTVSVRLCHDQLVACRIRIAGKKKWLDRRAPGEINQLLVRQHRVRIAEPFPRFEQSQTQKPADQRSKRLLKKSSRSNRHSLIRGRQTDRGCSTLFIHIEALRREVRGRRNWMDTAWPEGKRQAIQRRR